VCQVFKYYYYVPYNLFGLFLVHKISIYAYVYENRKKEMEKGKIKGFSLLTGPWGFRPSWGACARQAAQPAHASEIGGGG
jgi:hypothetical protein